MFESPIHFVGVNFRKVEGCVERFFHFTELNSSHRSRTTSIGQERKQILHSFHPKNLNKELPIDAITFFLWCGIDGLPATVISRF